MTEGHAGRGGQDPPSRLDRRLGTTDAVFIGLGAMVGAGIFAALGPASEAAGGGLLIGLALAAVVAACNATSSAQLAAIYPRSGGTYVYGRERLGHLWGFLAGWGFVVGKIASCAAMALTFGSYASEDLARPLAVGAVVVLTVVNLRGIRSTATLTKLIVALVLTCLAATVVAATTADPSWSRVGSLTDAGARGILQAAGFLFFAFAGYARIATLGEAETGRVAIDVAVVDARPADATATDSLLALEARDGSALSIGRALGRLPAYAMIARRYRRILG